jgi:hypothetical protein
MSSQKSARRSRKRHSPGRAAARPSAPAPRPEPQPEARTTPTQKTGIFTGTTYGERPQGMFGGLPVSEVAIAAGLIAVVVGWTRHGGPALFVGIAICFLGVFEVTAREHFSGYRSHSALLAGMVAVAAETGLAIALTPRTRVLLLVVVIPVFAGAFMLLRKRFSAARQARVRAIPRG